MATLGQIHAALQGAVSTALAGVETEGGPPVVAVGWPPVNTLQLIAQGQPAQVAVYDQRTVRNSTRWNPMPLSETVVTATLTSAVSAPVIGPGDSITITLGGTVTPGDAVSAVIQNFATLPRADWAEVVTGGSTDTPTTMATALAAAINADITLNEWVTASAAGAVVTVTSLLAQGNLKLFSNTGNGGTRTTEIGRRARGLMIVLWAQTEEDRQAIGDPIEEFLTNASANFGIALPDGTMGRIIPGADYYREDDTLQDVYRRDFLLTMDYGITTTDALFAVLAPVSQFQLN